MKKITMFSLLVLLTMVSRSQNPKHEVQLKASIDKRVELASIAARLAGYEEYNINDNKLYVRDIQRYFESFKTHPLITYMRELREKTSIGFDAVMVMAVHLNAPPDLNPVTPFNDSIPDARWGKKPAEKFAALLKQFYHDTDCETFFKDHADEYQIAANRFELLLKQLDINWYYQYYGAVPDENFNITIGLANGGQNYGVKVIPPGKKKNIYAIMGCWTFDDTGRPLFSREVYLPILIHEFNHSFINYLVDKYQKILEPSGTAIFKALSSKMEDQAYGDQTTMLKESLVKASVIRYLMDHHADSGLIKKQLQEQLNRGFIWTQQLVDLLGRYAADRGKYQTLESFMPQLVIFYDNIAANIKSIQRNYSKTLVHVNNIKPFKNGDSNVSPSVKEIKVYFDRALSGHGVSISYGTRGNKYYPGIKFLGYTEGNSAILLEVTLEPDHDYQFVLTGRHFMSTDGHPLEDYEVNFRTAKQ